jgi:hypothetical protein
MTTIREAIMNMNQARILYRKAMLAILAMAVAGGLTAQQAATLQKLFDTPQAAADALIKAAEANDTAALAEIFGAEGKELYTSGDSVQDKNQLAAFVAKAKGKMSVAADPKHAGRAILTAGSDNWPMPVPIVKSKGKWRFDSKAGLDEVLRRRVGANELDAIQVCRGFVDAQKDYAILAREVTGVSQYAQRIISSPGKRDGLYWTNPDGSSGGPISERVAKAIEEGYSADARSAYHGYYFKVLKGQGPAAPLGQMDYVIQGTMIGGFALIATPAEYGVSGVKTFIVSYDGIVYEKDLGPDSLKIVKGIERYNPDKTWHATNDEWPPDTSN